ncbi:putative GLT8D3 protein, partial [Operophtera brumata]
DNTKIVISFVVCDSRFNESINVVKSILLFTRVHVHFVIFADDVLWVKLIETLTNFKVVTNNQLGYELHKINFPEPHKEFWLNLFRKCAAQRLFLPDRLKSCGHTSQGSTPLRYQLWHWRMTTRMCRDAMIYVDIDTLFLGPVEELWAHFSRFNSSQISAMALEDDNPNVSWYPRFASHPFYGKYGLNSGVMLMNLTRMRDFGWVDYDIINIIFYYQSRAVLVLSCRYNYRQDQCMYGDACGDAAAHGVFLLHGSRRAFHGDAQPAFQAVYRAIDEYELGTDPSNTLLSNIDKYISASPASNCASLKDAFLTVPNNTFQRLYSLPDR